MDRLSHLCTYCVPYPGADHHLRHEHFQDPRLCRCPAPGVRHDLRARHHHDGLRGIQPSAGGVSARSAALVPGGGGVLYPLACMENSFPHSAESEGRRGSSRSAGIPAGLRPPVPQPEGDPLRPDCPLRLRNPLDVLESLALRLRALPRPCLLERSDPLDRLRGGPEADHVQAGTNRGPRHGTPAGLGRLPRLRPRGHPSEKKRDAAPGASGGGFGHLPENPTSPGEAPLLSIPRTRKAACRSSRRSQPGPGLPPPGCGTHPQSPPRRS